MKNLVTVLFAGALAATVAFAQGNTNWANNLNRAKLGRDLPYVTNAQAVSECECGMAGCMMAKAAVKPAAVVAHNDAAERTILKTGRRPEAAATEVIAGVSPTHNDAELRAFLKTGRATPQAEPAVKAEAGLVASRENSMCVAMGCCKAHTD